MRIKIEIVTRSGQRFSTHVPKEKLADCYKHRKIDFKKPLIIEAADPTKDPAFIINGLYIESVTLTEIADS